MGGLGFLDTMLDTKYKIIIKNILKKHGLKARRETRRIANIWAQRIEKERTPRTKTMFTLGARALVPGYQHKMVLCSDTGCTRYQPVHI